MIDLDLNGFTVKKGEVFEYIAAPDDIRAYPLMILAPNALEEVELGTVCVPLQMRVTADKHLMAEARGLIDKLCRSFRESTGRWTTRQCSLDAAGDNPLVLLDVVRKQGWSLSADSRISAWIKTGTGHTFYEFSGGIRETGDSFSFRLFDAVLLQEMFHRYENIDYFHDLNYQEA